MRVWERITVMREKETWYEAELYEQSVRNYLIGCVVARLWWVVIRIVPWTLAEHDRKPFGWRLRFELWCSFDRPRKGRKFIARHRFDVDPGSDSFSKKSRLR